MQFLSAPIKDATTGTVIVLTTPDAQRTMLAYQVRYATNEEYYYIYFATSLLKFEKEIYLQQFIYCSFFYPFFPLV